MTRSKTQELVSVSLNSDAVFIFPQGGYWSQSVCGLYEPEIGWILRRAAERPYAFLDGGANYGYWSILASSAPYGRHSSIAIEASLRNFEYLVKNAHANGCRFHSLRRALLDESGRQVILYGKSPAGMSLRKDWHPDDIDCCEDVETITLDDVADRYLPDRKHPAFIKLDVEGSEIEAIKGGRRLIDEGALIVYEDHGKEPSHPVSRFVLSLEDIEIWSFGPDERAIRITGLDQVAAIKKDPIVGYNFFAYRRPSPWSSLFEE
jgi:FkbM family methyltransferase